MTSISHVKAFEMDIPVSQLFPLLSPEGEKRWMPGWDYDNIMGTTDLAEDYVFLTKTHDHRGADAVWIVKRYEPESHLVQFYKVEPEDKVGVVTVKCTPLGPARTKVEVGYRYIALSERGETFVRSFDAQAYADFIAEWQTLLLRYFESERTSGDADDA